MTLEKEYLDITFLKENGFVRKRCIKCGKNFWTTSDRETCGDPPCGGYTFIGNSPFRKSFELDEMREFYLRFFEERGHARIERYPVVARWRDDIYLTIASIADFQPFVTAGIAPPPANPLTISQPCIRLDDLDSVGRTGRHLTLFEMMAHHAFNFPGKEVYWKNETVVYCTELLEKLGIGKENIVYKEEPWAGGGNAGPCLEAIVNGLELATLVFMNLQLDNSGDIEIKGERYRRMDNYIVDTGYGLERFVWMSKGSPTVYDAIFGKVLDKIFNSSGLNYLKGKDLKSIVAETSKLAGMGYQRDKILTEISKKFEMSVEEVKKLTEPIAKIYALADHTRCLLFMLGDGLVPSNAGAGYLARLIIRRSLRIMEELQISLEIYDLVELHGKNLGFKFEIPLKTIGEILKLEKERFEATVSKGLRLIERTIEKKKSIEKEDLIEFYDSHGIPAELALKIAEEKNVKVELPADLYSELAKKHSKALKEEKREIKLSKSYPRTEKLYYDNPKLFEFTAKVIGFENGFMILDKTAFYPESGGQDSDTGFVVADGKKIRVLYTTELDGIVLHKLENSIVLEGEIKGYIDPERRLRHMRHHSATHVLLYTLQKLYGKHIWQAGAKKEFEKARLDVSHYKKFSDEEVREIERLANKEVFANKPIKWFWMDRIDAEKKFGFRLYQGGVPPGREIRIVQVGEDVQACGGTHCSSTGEIGVIKILSVDSIQDGVIRFEFAVAESAIEAISKMESLLKDSSKILRVEPQQLPKTVERFFEEWKEQKKEIEKLKEKIAEIKGESLLRNAEDFNGLKIVAEVISADMAELQKLGEYLAKKGVLGCLMAPGEGKAFVVAFAFGDHDAREIMREVGRYAKGSGGGRKELAQGAVEKLLSRDELASIIFSYLSRKG
ncbi:MAG: alanine--tRNA ligase [Archaeoglobaceae archaeon]|nr:alanine--tRNA ligase [Archaeoglobaceae archaeon]MDW8118174.1 alanine--tRNA ligase [Archaeoglobaceae archaeon]